MTNRYFKRRWEETRGDDHDAWGGSTWYFEVASDGSILRQVESYDEGPTLRYGPDHPEDEYGELGQGRLDAVEDWAPWTVPASEFETAWSTQG